MKTLAQRVLEECVPYEYTSGEYERSVLHTDLVKDALAPKPPPTVLHSWTPPATRFVFEENIFETIYSMMQAKALTWDQICSASRWPCDRLWLEGPADDTRDGFLCVRVNDGYHCSVVMERRRGMSPVVVATFKMPLLPCDPNTEYVRGGWDLLKGTGAHTGAEFMEMVRTFAESVMDMLFMLSVPRVCEVRDVLVRGVYSRAQHEHPMVEYKRVRLRIGKAPVRYEARRSGESIESYHRRLHQVIGHFRTYVKGRTTPRVSWIPEHWRGDPEMGVLLHEHHVEK